MMLDANIPAQIRAARAFRKMRLEDVAASVSDMGWRANKQTICKIENGTRKVTLEEIILLALALDVDPHEFLKVAASRALEAV